MLALVIVVALLIVARRLTRDAARIAQWVWNMGSVPNSRTRGSVWRDIAYIVDDAERRLP